MGASTVFAIDINQHKLTGAEKLGATPIDAAGNDPVVALTEATQGKGIDVALEVIGLAKTMQQAVQCLGVFGRAALACISEAPFQVDLGLIFVKTRFRVNARPISICANE